MIAGFNYLTQTQENKWIFNAAGNSWQFWDRPDGCNFVYIVMIGAGGGGGGGVLKASAGASTGGGGGGAAAGVSSLMIPAYAIQDRLHIQVGVGGAGGLGASAGSVGTQTYVSLVPNTGVTTAHLLYTASTTPGGNASGGAGGAASVTFAVGAPGMAGKFQTIVPAIAGQNGGSTTNVDQTRIIGGGAGAANNTSNNVNGNAITSSYLQPSSVIACPAAPAGLASQAFDGLNILKPMPQFFGGPSGCSNGSIQGANGGNGGIGCGGGGGGTGFILASSGGRGGDGMVIITCW